MNSSNTQEPVGEVFTMEPLDGSGDVRSHVLLTKDLPAGTKIYAAPVAAQAQLESAELREARHDSAHAETESERVRALAYWLEQQTYEPDMLSNAADTLRAYLEEKSQAQPLSHFPSSHWANQVHAHFNQQTQPLPGSLIPSAPDLEYLRGAVENTALPAFLRGQIAAAVKALAAQAQQPVSGADGLQARTDALYIALEVCSAELFAQCADQPRAMRYVEQARHALASEQCARAAAGRPAQIQPQPSGNAGELPPMPDALADALSNLEHDNYERSYSGSKNRESDAALIRAALAQQDADMVSCGCGDLYPGNSYGAGFIAAAGHCENCDAVQDCRPEAVRALLAERDALRDALDGVLVDDLLPLLPAEYIAKVRAALAQNVDAEPAP